MNLSEYLEKVAYLGPSDIDGCDSGNIIYYSKFDDSYMGHVGNEKALKFLADREITENLSHGVGFSLKDGRWYGWSHRAICGFGVGSVVEKGDSASVSGYTQEYLDVHPEKDISLPVGFTALSLDDAKRMAQAFNESVS
jgi:hypothetical protein